MELLPKRSSLVAQTIVILRDAIRAGVWKDVLPGEHELCERFQVSRVTIRAALDQLQQEGWVVGGQGRRRKIAAGRISPKGQPASDCVVLLSPVALQNLAANTLFWVDALRDQLATAGYRLEFQASHACYSQHPEHALEALAQKHRAAGWVLYLSTAPLQRWFSDRGLPCVVSGSLHPGVKLTSVDTDYVATCQHAVGQFAAKGHRRVALLIPRSGQSGDLDSQRGFTEAGAKQLPHPVETSIAPHDGTVQGICRALDILARGKHPVTGLLVAKPAHVVTAFSHLLRSGVKIPQATSLISRDDDPLLENLVPAVARYHVDAQLFARKISRLVVDLVRSGASRRHDVRLVPAFFRGETLAESPLLQ